MLKMYHDQASDDSEEELVYVGQALPIEDHDEVLKKQTPRNQRAHVDKKGRPERLHGAFTGGFSAGYFNTVGSQDGWQPSTFVSSRDKATAKHDIRKPEDFMDDEDFGEHGIAPRKITTTKDYHSEKRPFSVKSSDADITELIISALATPTSISIGAKLMRKLGWKDGQGVGAKRKRRLKIPKKSSMKVYGCTLPSEQSSKDESDDEDDVYSAGLEFAPKDVCPIIFTAKDNNHGLGYSGITQLDNLLFEGSSHSTNISREQFMTSGVNNKKKRGITGQAFGIGVLNEDGDDDDIYTLDNISQYDRVLDGPKSSLHGWTAPTHSASGQLAICESSEGIPGYRLSSKKCEPKKIYKPPQLPRGWRAKHVFIEDLLPKESRIENKAESLSQKADMKHKRIERALALGETPTVLGSVFDLLSKEDKSRIETAKKYVPPHCQADSSKSLATAALQSTSSLPQKPPIDTPTSTSALALVPTIPPTTTLTAMSMITPTVTSSNTPTDSVASARISHQHSNFKPFAKDPEKQARYEKFLNDRAGTSSSPSSSDDVALTEWERSREREEFARASQLYRPVTGVMASRFTTAKYTDDVDEIIPADDTNKKTAIEQTSEVDAFGKTSREVLEWHPDRLLCKRFNVPNPYPQSTIVGLRHSRSKKYTLENPLAIPENDHDEIEDDAQRSMDAPSATHSLPTTATATHHTQPLPILATWELGTESSGEGKQQPKLQTEVAENVIQEVSEPANTERPSMDLFKAIFSSSDNSSSDDDDDSDDNDDDDVSAEKKDSGDKNTDKHEDSVISAGDKSDKNSSATAASPAPTTSSHQHPTVLSKETVGSDEPRVQHAGRIADTHMTDSHAEDRPAADRHTIDGHVSDRHVTDVHSDRHVTDVHSDRHVTDVHSDRHVTDVHSDRPNASLDTKSVSQTLVSHSSDTSREQEKKDLSQGLEEAEQYGPALPSTILIGSDSDTDSFPDVGASAKKHKKKSKKKEKRKSKKKHKHKRSSSDPKEDAKLDDMSLLKKLKSLPTKRRPTAADFM